MGEVVEKLGWLGDGDARKDGRSAAPSVVGKRNTVMNVRVVNEGFSKCEGPSLSALWWAVMM